jgi:hypothetical protein
MKKILLFVAVALLGTSVTFAQAKLKKEKKAKASTEVKAYKPEITGAGMKFETETVDYGTIQQNADGKREFVFVNNGDKPLILWLHSAFFSERANFTWSKSSYWCKICYR